MFHNLGQILGKLAKNLQSRPKIWNYGISKNFLNYELRIGVHDWALFFWVFNKVQGLPWELHLTTSP